MYDRSVSRLSGGEARTTASGATQRVSSAAGVRDAERDADRTLENLRRRRDSVRPRPADAKLRTFARVLVGERERRLYLLAPGEIDYIESRGNYVEFHADDLVFISRDSIKRLSRTLIDSGYIR